MKFHSRFASSLWRSSSHWRITSWPWSNLSETARYCVREGWSPLSWLTVRPCCWTQITHYISLWHGSWRSSPPRQSHLQTSGKTGLVSEVQFIWNFYFTEDDLDLLFLCNSLCFIFFFFASDDFFLLVLPQKVLVFRGPFHVLGWQSSQAIETGPTWFRWYILCFILRTSPFCYASVFTNADSLDTFLVILIFSLSFQKQTWGRSLTWFCV